MSAIILMFVCGYFFHLANKVLDIGFTFIIGAVKSRREKVKE